ncbi:1,4-alpha-glucan branching protein GlgB [Pelagibius sp. 7325]|uniref:1,4-alpha-glucan branching protein GlgB n=1 Tax=Pelagibius sp. 7325 TaxID=3131994 RepID=UPI0030EC0149
MSDHSESPIGQLPDPAEIDALVRGAHGDPFHILGMHGAEEGRLTVRAFVPGADAVEVTDRKSGRRVAELRQLHDGGFFAGPVPRRKNRFPYRLRARFGDGSQEMEDPYRFPPVLGELDLHLMAEGSHRQIYHRLGAHPVTLEGVEGVSFAVWAPNAQRVSVVGDFNNWDGRCHPMRKRHEVGVWELFIPDLQRGALYKYEIIDARGQRLPLKADPLAFEQEQPPATSSRVHGLVEHDWRDGAWLQRRGAALDVAEPISIYEVHAGSWRRGEEGEPLDYDRLADQLIAHVKDLGFTHIELLPVSEHPFGGSWGYQPLGLFAPTRRFGPPEAFARFVDRCHQEGIGVIIDWVPAHFPSDEHGLGRFDGTALYEHEDPRLGFHHDWNTLIYNFGRREVSNFLQANALFWLSRYHVDALRVDAVASMLYLDYSREPEEWIPNRYGGNENLDAIAFLRQTNANIATEFPGTGCIAEESTAWPGVSRPTDEDGLGFAYKWNMGWMHDTLEYMRKDPIYRRHHQDQITFSLVYAFSENFILPLSHDEVVYGKGSLLNKMPGDQWQKFANLRAYYAFMWGHPGKKLLFMGGEIAQEREWDHDGSVDWHLTESPLHAGMMALLRDLNRVYRDLPALHQRDCDERGFQWIDASNAAQSVLAFLRKGEEGTAPVLVILNFTPEVRRNYRLGVPEGGYWREVLNSDAEIYGGSNVGNDGGIAAGSQGLHDQPHSIELTLPPLGALMLTPAREGGA